MDEMQQKLIDALAGCLGRQIAKCRSLGMQPPYDFLFSSPNGKTLDGVIFENLTADTFSESVEGFDFPIALKVTDARGKTLETSIDRIH